MGSVDEKTAPSNFIRTSKYSWWSFLPLFLFEQYKQPNNIYYLLNAIAGYIVVLITPIANVLPIIFVLLMAAIREIIEDAGRHRSDNEQNSTPYTVIRNKAKLTVPSHDIRQGDILVLKDKDYVPVDGMLLQSSSDSGICFISTANLDGEVNLKPKVQVFKQPLTPAELNQVSLTVTTDPPANDMLRF